MTKQFAFTPQFAKFLSMSVLGMLGSVGTILADTFFVAQQLGPTGLTALNIALPIFGIINGLGLMIGIGGATYYSISKARGLDEESNDTYSTALMMAAFVGVLIWIGGMVFSKETAYLFGANAETIAMCQTYLKVIMCFAPWFLFNHLFISFIRNDGNAHLPMMAMLVGNFANIFLDYLFMYPMQMGIFGSALATGLAPLLGILTSSTYLLAKKQHFHLHKYQLKLVPKIMSLGVTSFVNEFSSGIVIMIFNILILKYAGNTGVAAYGVIANYALVVLAVFTGMSQGAQPLLSQSYGARQDEMTERLYRSTLLVSFIFSLMTIIVFWVWTSPLVTIFNSHHDMALQQLAIQGLRLYVIGFLFSGYDIMTAVYFSSTEKARIASIISIFRGLVGMIIIALIMSYLFHLTGIWLTFPVVELVTAILVFGLKKRYS